MSARFEAARLATAWVNAREYPAVPRPKVHEVPFSIAISREAGAGGTQVAREVGRRLNWPVYDDELLAKLAEELKTDSYALECLDERPGSPLVDLLGGFKPEQMITEVAYFRGLVRLIVSLAHRGECIVVGRGGMQIMPAETTLRVRLVACRKDRLALLERERGMSPVEAERYLDSTDRERRRFIRTHFHKELDDPLLYDLILNSSSLSIDECASMVIEGLQRFQARRPKKETMSWPS